ncbi:MAG TPA: cob(I)yrinic acid a,c-diamide adenosyltransferase [Chromatiales bacterium]|nr:cob(I)yrinic acid a,c-diamide adenosyltransferase [Chromatiales bacterium]
MGHRLSKIATRTGDNGTTGLADGSRINKDDPRIVAMGDIDELNSSIGLILIHPLPNEISTLLNEIQHRMFDLGGELSMPGKGFITEESVTKLEHALASLNAALPPLKEFILPGGTPAAAHCHMARTICRRAERSVITLVRQTGLSEHTHAVAYLNRLSDLLFVIARTLAREIETDEPLWKTEGKPSNPLK